MNEELNNLVDDILKEKLKLHYENEELEAQGKLIKELCKENKHLHSIIKEVRKYIERNKQKTIIAYGDNFDDDFDIALDEEDIDNILEILDREK